jgi:hypothetical protein
MRRFKEGALVVISEYLLERLEVGFESILDRANVTPTVSTTLAALHYVRQEASSELRTMWGGPLVDIALGTVLGGFESFLIMRLAGGGFVREF